MSGSEPSPVPEPVSRAAVDWWVRLRGPDVGTRERAGWEQWRKAHPDHERAWQHIEACTRQWQGVSAPVAQQVLVREVGAGRRRAVKALALLLCAGGGAAMVGGLRYPLGATHRTGVGEQWVGTLNDGSVVTLDTDSAIAVAMDEATRRIRVLRGRVLIRTAARASSRHDARPMIVDTPQGELRPLGTVFSVQRQEDATTLTVFEGVVQASPTLAPEASIAVPAGRQVRFTATQISPLSQVDPGSDAWTAGMLVARGMPLAAFLAELGRYRHGRLVATPEASRLSVSGVYPVHDTDAVLAQLQDALPIAVDRRTALWITVRLR